MAKKFLTTIKLLNLTQDPATGSSGEIYFNSSTNKERIYKNGSWTNLVDSTGGSTTSAIIEYGAGFPESPDDGKLFYNLNSERIYFFFNNIWKTIPYLEDFAKFDGGQSQSNSFEFTMDGEYSYTSQFDMYVDARFSSDSTEMNNTWPDNGSSQTDSFVYTLDSENSSTTQFTITVNGGSSLPIIYNPVYGGLSSENEFNNYIFAGTSTTSYAELIDGGQSN